MRRSDSTQKPSRYVTNVGMVRLTATHRDDGNMFVVSSSHPYISTIVEIDDWDNVLDLVKLSLQVNVGQVRSIEYVDDAASYADKFPYLGELVAKGGLS